MCDIERCNNEGTYQLKQANYRLCDAHEQQWKGGGVRLRANAKKHTLRLVEEEAAEGPAKKAADKT
jgi:hypothetical protein